MVVPTLMEVINVFVSPELNLELTRQLVEVRTFFDPGIEYCTRRKASIDVWNQGEGNVLKFVTLLEPEIEF